MINHNLGRSKIKRLSRFRFVLIGHFIAVLVHQTDMFHWITTRFDQLLLHISDGIARFYRDANGFSVARDVVHSNFRMGHIVRFVANGSVGIFGFVPRRVDQPNVVGGHPCLFSHLVFNVADVIVGIDPYGNLFTIWFSNSDDWIR